MKLIGITGGIATGKSVVAGLIKTKGYPVINADKVGHQVLEMESVKKTLIKEFGDILGSRGKVDRKKLGDIVFEDREKLKVLNGILHPKMVNMILKKSEEIKELNEEIFVEAAVLFEMGLDKHTDFIVVTDCPDEVRIERLMKRDRLSFDEAKKRVNFQSPREFFLKKADWVIDTSKDFENTSKQVFKMLNLRPWSDKI